MLLRVWARAYIRSLYSCVRRFVLAYADLFLRFCVCGNGPAYMGSYLRLWDLTYVHGTPSRGPTLPIFTSFSFVSLLYAILTHFLSFLHMNITVTFFLSLFLYQKHHFSSILLESRI